MSKKLSYTLLGVIVIALGVTFYWFKSMQPDPNAPTPIDSSSSGLATKEEGVYRQTFRLNLAGDILPARAVELTMRKQGYDYPFLKIKDYLADADITFANLESPLIGTATSGRTTPGGTTVFRGDVDFADALKRAGIDVVSLANNHMGDQGQKGISSTLSTLDKSGLQHAGAGMNLDQARRMAILEIPTKDDVKPLKIGFLAYNDADVVPESYHASSDHAGSNIMSIDRLKEDIAINRDKVDLLFVSMHSGTEYAATGNSHQTEFAHTAIDAGADGVIGHHPHVLQPIEVYKGKYIFYSLGNFVFDQPWPNTKQSVLIHMNISGSYNKETSKWSEFSYYPQIIPLRIANFQPEPIARTASAEYEAVLERFRFPWKVLTLGTENLLVRVASTSAERQKGLSGTGELPQGQALLFKFDAPGKHGIWMKDMLYPIDIYWFDSNFNLIDQRISVATSTYPDVFYPKSDALYVLETRVGEIRDKSLTERLTGLLTEPQYYDKK